MALGDQRAQREAGMNARRAGAKDDARAMMRAALAPDRPLEQAGGSRGDRRRRAEARPARTGHPHATDRPWETGGRNPEQQASLEVRHKPDEPGAHAREQTDADDFITKAARQLFALTADTDPDQFAAKDASAALEAERHAHGYGDADPTTTSDLNADLIDNVARSTDDLVEEHHAGADFKDWLQENYGASLEAHAAEFSQLDEAEQQYVAEALGELHQLHQAGLDKHEAEQIYQAYLDSADPDETLEAFIDSYTDDDAGATDSDDDQDDERETSGWPDPNAAAQAYAGHSDQPE